MKAFYLWSPYISRHTHLAQGVFVKDRLILPQIYTKNEYGLLLPVEHETNAQDEHKSDDKGGNKKSRDWSSYVVGALKVITPTAIVSFFSYQQNKYKEKYDSKIQISEQVNSHIADNFSLLNNVTLTGPLPRLFYFDSSRSQTDIIGSQSTNAQLRANIIKNRLIQKGLNDIKKRTNYYAYLERKNDAILYSAWYCILSITGYTDEYIYKDIEESLRLTRDQHYRLQLSLAVTDMRVIHMQHRFEDGNTLFNNIEKTYITPESSDNPDIPPTARIKTLIDRDYNTQRNIISIYNEFGMLQRSQLDGLPPEEQLKIIESAIENLSTALKIKIGAYDPVILSNLAFSYNKKAQIKMGINRSNGITPIDDEINALITSALKHHRDAYKYIRKFDANNCAILNGLGFGLSEYAKTLTSKEKKSIAQLEAKTHLEEAHKLSPNNIDIICTYSELLIDMGLIIDAKNLLLSAEAINHDYLGEVYYLLAKCFFEEKNREEALKYISLCRINRLTRQINWFTDTELCSLESQVKELRPSISSYLFQFFPYFGQTQPRLIESTIEAVSLHSP